MSGEWISAWEARCLALEYYKDATDAELCIFRLAKDGKVRTQADEFRIGSPARLPLATGADIPQHFWGAIIEAHFSGQWLDENPRTRWIDWETGCFAISIASQAYEAKDTRFNRENMVTALPVIASSAAASAAPFTDAEIDQFIRETELTGMKKARSAFMKGPRAKGLSATFEARWNLIKQRRRGRPRSKS